jgi:parvulin-like peptidyl-prolyl isomerase
VWLALLLTLACFPMPEAPAPAPEAPPPAQPEAEDARSPQIDATTAEASAGERIAARHILITWKGALQASGVSRDKDEARALAQSLLERLRAGEDFATLARKYSDDQVSGARGGSLGVFGRGEMVQAFEQAAFALPIGGQSDLVESPFGYHIIRLDGVDQIVLSEILVEWQGAQDALGVTRDKEAARARIDEAARRLAAGEPFARVAHELSDGAVGPWGGGIGAFQRGELPPRLDAAVFALAPGQRSDVVETAAGFHIFQRDP